MEKINDRLVQLEIDVLSANDKKAAQNREKFNCRRHLGIKPCFQSRKR